MSCEVDCDSIDSIKGLQRNESEAVRYKTCYEDLIRAHKYLSEAEDKYFLEVEDRYLESQEREAHVKTLEIACEAHRKQSKDYFDKLEKVTQLLHIQCKLDVNFGCGLDSEVQEWWDKNQRQTQIDYLKEKINKADEEIKKLQEELRTLLASILMGINL